MPLASANARQRGLRRLEKINWRIIGLTPYSALPLRKKAPSAGNKPFYDHCSRVLCWGVTIFSQLPSHRWSERGFRLASVVLGEKISEE